MERNPTANNYGYYKDPINYSTNTACGDIYQLTYPFDDDLKDRRYQLSVQPPPHPPPPNAVASLPSQQHSLSQSQQASQSAALQYHHQAYLKSDQTSYKAEKPPQHANMYNNYNYPTYKDYQYSYYDQYKYNPNFTTATTNYSPPKAKEAASYHQNYTPGVYSDSKLTTSYCDETNMPGGKGSIVKSTNSPQISQYPMYPNCYGYPAAAAAAATTFANQNYCSYAQNCTDDARILWDDYQTNRRLLSSYVSAAPAPTVATASMVAPPQTNNRLKASYNGDYYGASAASYSYHTEALRAREKLLYPMNSHPAAPTADNLYSSRSRCLPMEFKYQSMPSHQNMLSSYDRLNYVSDAQNYDYCAQRQDPGTYHLSPYSKGAVVNGPQKHIRATAMTASDYCNPQSYYFCNEPISTELQDPYSQQYLKDSRHNVAAYNAAMMTSGPTRNISASNDLINKEHIYNHQSAIAASAAEAYYQQNSQGVLGHGAVQSKATLGRGQNLREFLATWNEDEDDGMEKMEDENSPSVYLQQANIEVENGPVENHLQFKGSFNTRPKIHVGITVDSNVANNQYINLPDIIIDIEKSKETDLITHTVDNTTAVTGSTASAAVSSSGGGGGGGTEKVVLLESVDVPPSDLNHYTNISLFESTVDEPMKELTDVPEIVNFTGVSDLVTPTDEVLQKVDETKENLENSRKTEETVKPPKKWKRYKRFLKPKVIDRTDAKCRIIGKIIKTKRGKLIRIRKVLEKTRKRRIIQKKTKFTLPATMLHSQIEENTHSVYNPKTLNELCICFFNSEIGREFLMQDYTDSSSSSTVITKEDKEEVESVTPPSDESHEEIAIAMEIVPKLSALCEHALNNFYEQNNILLLNLDDLENNIYFVGCDINENVVNSETAAEDGNGLNDNGFIELFVDDETDMTTEDLIRNPIESDNVNNSTCSSFKFMNNSLNENGSYLNEHHSSISTTDDLCLAADENSRDFSALHHEEIVPDNLHAFESEKLLKYLQNKYIQKNNHLKILIIDKICKKYRKYILKRRKQRQQLTKKLLLPKTKDNKQMSSKKATT